MYCNVFNLWILYKFHQFRPTVFNMCTTDQPVSTDSDVKHCIYTDNTAIVVQNENFENVEKKLAATLDVLGKYYRRNYLIHSPGKTHVCAFPLKNRCVSRILNVYWNVMKLINAKRLKYLGVTLFSLCVKNQDIKISWQNVFATLK